MLTTLMIAAVLAASPSTAQTGAQPPSAAQAAPAAKVPDTPAGRALNEFVASFNAGGDKRRAWLEERTTLEAETAANILKQDTAFLDQHGAVTVVRIAESSDTTIAAILRHAKSGAHGHLTIDVEPKAPHKISNMQLRGATPEEVEGK